MCHFRKFTRNSVLEEDKIYFSQDTIVTEGLLSSLRDTDLFKLRGEINLTPVPERHHDSHSRTDVDTDSIYQSLRTVDY